MSGYSDYYKDQQRREFIDRWAPNQPTSVTVENLRWNMARANAAEAELRELKDALKVLKGALR